MPRLFAVSSRLATQAADAGFYCWPCGGASPPPPPSPGSVGSDGFVVGLSGFSRTIVSVTVTRWVEVLPLVWVTVVDSVTVYPGAVTVVGSGLSPSDASAGETVSVTVAVSISVSGGAWRVLVTRS